MKTLGAVLIISGLLISVIGYGEYSSVLCHCPAQIAGKPFTCHCMDNLEQIIGHIMVYAGFGITGGGIFAFVSALKKRQSFGRVEK